MASILFGDVCTESVCADPLQRPSFHGSLVSAVAPDAEILFSSTLEPVENRETRPSTT
jgi:hypothetical protein